MNHSSTPWGRVVLPVASIFSFRMLGLFMLIPVFTVYAETLTSSTPLLVGLALGSYGLTQGLLQMPFGMLSDRFGRKPLLTAGLILFAAGSLLGAFSHSIYGILAARTLQGMGAIGSVLTALLADLTPDASRTKAMAVIGAAIGLSFSIAMILSPLIANVSGLSGIFYTTFVLALLGLVLLYTVIPNPPRRQTASAPHPGLIAGVLHVPALRQLNIGIFFQHLVLTSTFFVIPLILGKAFTHGKQADVWQFYLPLVSVSFIAMIPLIGFAERRKQMQHVFPGCILVTGLCQAALLFTPEYGAWFAGILFIYFVCFNFLEASLPSLVSRVSDQRVRGTAMGVYSSCQFLGIFAGGTLAGLTSDFFGNAGIFAMNTLCCLGWFFFGRKITSPTVVS